VAIIHVHEADRLGNARIVGTTFEDILMVKAARRVILTAERVVEGDDFARAPENVSISGFMVDAVVEAPGGAWPGGCVGLYDYDAAYLAVYVAASKLEESLRQVIAEHILDPSPAVAAR
jgi:hypothetical protein